MKQTATPTKSGRFSIHVTTQQSRRKLRLRTLNSLLFFDEASPTAWLPMTEPPVKQVTEWVQLSRDSKHKDQIA